MSPVRRSLPDPDAPHLTLGPYYSLCSNSGRAGYFVARMTEDEQTAIHLHYQSFGGRKYCVPYEIWEDVLACPTDAGIIARLHLWETRA